MGATIDRRGQRGPDMSDQIPESVQKTIQILTDYFKSEGQSEEEAARSINNIAAMVQEPGAKLVQYRNVVFMVLVRGEGAVEFHTAGNEKNPRDFVRDLVDLANYLKSIGVKVMYSYASDPKYKTFTQMTKLPWKYFDVDLDGQPMVAYVLEL